jgi:hypothetical protein
MYGLIRLISIALRRLTCTEKGETCIWQIELHKLGDSECPIMQTEAALERAVRILDAVTCEVRNG